MTDDDRTAVLETSLIIGDRRVDDSKGGWMEHINPATGKPNPKKISVASVEEVDDAVTAARDGFRVWRSWTPDKRRDALFRLADVLVENSALLGNRRRARDRRAPTAGTAGSTRATGSATTRAGPTRSPARASTPTRSPASTSPVPEPSASSACSWRPMVRLGFFGMAGAPALAAGCSIVIKSPELAPFSPVDVRAPRARSGHPAGRRQRRERRRRRRQCARDPSRGRQGQLHRRHRDRQAPPGGVRGDPQADGDGARRQVGEHHLRRRRHRRRDPALGAASPTTPARAARCRHACSSSGRSTTVSSTACTRRPSRSSSGARSTKASPWVRSSARRRRPHRRPDHRGQGHRCRGRSSCGGASDRWRPRRRLLRRADHPRRRRQLGRRSPRPRSSARCCA